MIRIFIHQTKNLTKKNMSQRHVSARKGFTLIELLVVITIIGILAAALLPQILGAPARARDTARVAAVAQIVTAIETYNSDEGSYPDPDITNCVPAVLDKYFQGGSAPKDPNSKDVKGCNGAYYYCVHDGDPVSYSVAAKMEITGGQANGLESELLTTCTNAAAAASPTYTSNNTSDVYVITK